MSNALRKTQFRILYREFLFRIVDLELLSAHAEGDSRALLGQFAALLFLISLNLAAFAAMWASRYRRQGVPALARMVGAWNVEFFLIATTMLIVGIFAMLSWESTFPTSRDVHVLGPLPIRARTLFLAKVAAVATALGLTLAILHSAAGLSWPFALAEYHSTPSPALVFDPALPPAPAAGIPAVMDRDMTPMLRRLDLLAADGGAGIVIGVSESGVRRIMTYGAAKPDSLFEIGSITKTFTGLLLSRMAAERRVDLRDPVRGLVAPKAAKPAGFEITLLDLATHRSGLPLMPDNGGPWDEPGPFSKYSIPDLFQYIASHGLTKPADTKYAYSNLGFAILGQALASRAQTRYPELLEREITGPLGLKDTAVSLSDEQFSRLLKGHDVNRQPGRRWDADAFTPAGGIRSTAGDMLTYLEAQLRPALSPFPSALVQSQRLFAYSAAGSQRIALAWAYQPDTGIYWHNGATWGYTAYVCFNPRRQFAVVVLLNSRSLAFPIIDFLGEHARQRLTGAPAISLAPVAVPPAGPIRSLFAYWVAMIAAGAFIFCCVLGLQGLAAQFLPRRWFLRASAFLQLGVFCLLVIGYFIQRPPVDVLVAGSQKPWISWIPSYWFVGLYQQLSGALHPALAPFARRAWMGLLLAVCATASAYAASYLRTLRKIVEEPDVAPGFKHVRLPRFGGAFETAIAHFSIRSLTRSSRHRTMFAFYLGAALAFAIFFLNAPQELSGDPASQPPDRWHQPTVPMLASTIAVMLLWVVGARVVFSLPLDLRANWIFRVMPFAPGRRCLAARRWAIYLVAVAPAWAISAAALFWLWPWRPAAAHLAALGLFGAFLAEFSVSGVLKIPFTCSYLPGKSRIHITLILWIYALLFGTVSAAIAELDALTKPAVFGAILTCLAALALFFAIRNNWMADPVRAELRYEEEPPDKLLSLTS